MEDQIYISPNDTMLGDKLDSTPLPSKTFVAILASIELFESFMGFADVKVRSNELEIDEKRLKTFQVSLNLNNLEKAFQLNT